MSWDEAALQQQSEEQRERERSEPEVVSPDSYFDWYLITYGCQPPSDEQGNRYR